MGGGVFVRLVGSFLLWAMVDGAISGLLGIDLTWRRWIQVGGDEECGGFGTSAIYSAEVRGETHRLCRNAPGRRTMY